MARREQKFQVNTSGAFYVDRTCIDCLRCQSVAPEHFERDPAGHSFVRVQPETPEAIAACRNALSACPVSAIGQDGDLAGPPPLKMLLPGLYACGHPSDFADQADAYLIVRPEGNILIDVPSFHPALITQLEGLGDLRYIFLTHEDTMGEVEDFQLHFGAEVIMHASEADQVHLGVARAFSESGPLFPDVSVIHTPGHTRGSSCLLWRRHGGCLFVGDHLLPAGGDLVPVRFAWTDNWEQQLESAHLLISEPWHHAFPAHGADELPRGYMPKGKAKLESWLEHGAPVAIG